MRPVKSRLIGVFLIGSGLFFGLCGGAGGRCQRIPVEAGRDHEGLHGMPRRVRGDLEAAFPAHADQERGLRRLPQPAYIETRDATGR